MIIDIAYVEGLYEKHCKSLDIIKDKQRSKYTAFHNPGYDDVEAEILCLLILENQPKSILEVSPNTGWSTSYMLEAINFYEGAKIYGFDIHDSVTHTINDNRYIFTLGDFTKQNINVDDFDFFFIDSDHEAPFSHFYYDNILLKIKRQTPVAIHDIFSFSETPGNGEPCTGETAFIYPRIKDFCFTGAEMSKNSPLLTDIRRKCLADITPIHTSPRNPGAFFYFPVTEDKQ